MSKANKISKANDARSAIGQRFERSFDIVREAVNAEARTVELSFSSETPVARWFGDEVLGHNPGECDLSRLNNAAPFLLGHDTDDQIGVIESAEIGADKKGRAVVRFSKSERAQEIFQDIVDGIRRLVSVGYRVDEMQMVKSESNGKKETYRVNRWTPFEVSLVSVPADVSVGVGRSAQTEQTETAENRISTMKTETPEVTPAAPPDNAEAVKTERSRIAEITAIGTRFNKPAEAQKAIADGTAVADFRKLVLDGIRVEVIESPTVTTNTSAIHSARSVGEQFVASDSYRSFISGKGGKRSALFEVPNFALRTTFSASTESLTSIQKLPGVPGILENQPVRVANIIAPGSTSSTTIRYIQEDTFTNAAAAVAEGAAKAEASLDVSEVDATVRKVACYLKVTDEMLADHDQMRSFVDARLSYMVADKVDYYLLNGSGSSNQIRGLLNFSGINTQAVGGDKVHDSIYKAITKVRATSAFSEPDAVIMHPSDYQNLRLTVDGNGQYLGGGPFMGSYGAGGVSYVNAPVWGLPVVVTTNISQGTALVGAFRTKSQWFQKMGLTVETTNTDQDDFIKNLTTVRAEVRLALACYQPLAFCTVTGIPA